MNTEITTAWNRNDRDDKLQIIVDAIEMNNTSEGSLYLQLFRKNNRICGFIQTSPDNHLSVEAVSQDTLISLFGLDHDFEEEDAEVILEWMESQK